MSNIYFRTLYAGLRQYSIVWVTGGVISCAIVSAAGHLLSSGSGSPPNEPSSPTYAPQPRTPSSFLYRLLIAPWDRPLRSLLAASRGYPQPLQCTLFLLPSGLLLSLVFMQPLFVPSELPLWPQALRNTLTTLAGLHCLALSSSEAEAPAPVLPLLPVASGLLGLVLCARGTAALSPLQALQAAPSLAAAPVSSAPLTMLQTWQAWMGLQDLKKHTLVGLTEVGKYGRAAEIGLGLYGLPVPVTGIIESSKTLLGGVAEEVPTHLSAAALAEILRDSTWGQLCRNGPALASVAGTVAALLAVVALSRPRA
jgi:hypothetical protein